MSKKSSNMNNYKSMNEKIDHMQNNHTSLNGKVNRQSDGNIKFPNKTECNNSKGSDMKKWKGGLQEPKSENGKQTRHISENGELVVEPLVFEEKLNMWKGTINSIQEKKDDEKKLQVQRQEQLKSAKLLQHLQKEEKMLQKVYLEQLEKDEKLARQIEEELNSETRELNKLEEQDLELAKKLQDKINKENGIYNYSHDKRVSKKGSLESNQSCSDNSSKKNKIFNGKLKEKFRELFKKKSSI